MNALAPHPALQRHADAGSLLCHPVSDWTGAVPAGGAVVEPKEDGIRFLWIDGEPVTREGSAILGVDHIAEVLRAIEAEACQALFLDGELVVDRSFGATISHFQAAGARGNAGTLHLFDMIPMATWRGEEPCEALQARRAKLDQLAAPFVGDAVRLVPWAYMTDPAEIHARAQDLIAAGGEGIVAKDALSTYRRSVGTSWQRIRKSLSLDVPIIEVQESKAVPGRAGAIVVDVEGVRVKVPVRSSADQVALWQARHGLPGQIAEITALERTGRGSLRQPVLTRLRPDKRRAR